MPAAAVRLLSRPKAGHEPTLELRASLFLPVKNPLGWDGEPTEAGRPGRAPALIVAHGAGSRRTNHEPFCREACLEGFVVLALDLRGHGESSGVGDGPLEEDILAAARYLREHPAVNADRLCFRGSSMGGFYGLKAAPEALFAAMVLLCPASEKVMLDAIADEEARQEKSPISLAPDGLPERFGRRSDQARWDLTALSEYFRRQNSGLSASLVRCPVLLVHALGDETVPVAHTLFLAKQMRGETTVLALEEGTHTTAQHDPLVLGYSLAWLKTRCEERPKPSSGGPICPEPRSPLGPD